MAKSTKSGNVTFGSLALHAEFTVTGAEGTVYSKVTAKRALVVAGGQAAVGRNFEAGSVVFPTGTKAGSPSVADKVPSAGRFPPATLTVAASETPTPESETVPESKKTEEKAAPAPAEKAGVETTTEKVPAPVGATAAPAAKKPGRKAKAAPAPAAKKGAKAKAESNGEARAPRAKKEGLRKPQVKILAILAKSGVAMDRNEIAEKAGVDRAWLNSWIGSHDAEKRAKNDAAQFPSLISLGLVRTEEHQGGDSGTRTIRVHAITKEGRKALAAAEKNG